MGTSIRQIERSLVCEVIVDAPQCQVSRAMPFVFFTGMMALQFALVLLFFPETKGKTLEQIQAKLELA